MSRIAGREGERFISPDEQRRAIEGWCSLHGHSIAAWHSDLDQPGTKRDRPGLRDVMERAVGGEVKGIVVARLDRFGRSVPHLAELVEQLSDAGAGLFTVAEGIDSRGRTGRMVLQILSAIAEFEVARIGENWIAARSNAVSRGVYVGGTLPLGYRKGEDGRLIVGPGAPVVVELFERRARGESWASLARWLSEQISEDRSVGAVRHIIANRTYLGEVSGGGELVNPEAHPALVDAALFAEANRVRGVAPARSGRASGLLSGILRCAGCRYAMKPSQNAHGLEYRCKGSKRENAAVCPEPASVTARTVERLVLERFFGWAEDYRLRRSDGSLEIERAEGRLREAEAELDAALDTRLADALGAESERYLAMVKERLAAVASARDDVAAAWQARAGLPSEDFTALWPDLSLEEQRQLLASALDCVFVRRGSDVAERTFFCWRGEAPELPVRGRRWTPRPFKFDA